MSVGTIVAVVVAVLVVFAVVGGVVWYRRRWRGKTNVKYYKDMSKVQIFDDFLTFCPFFQIFRRFHSIFRKSS